MRRSEGADFLALKGIVKVSSEMLRTKGPSTKTWKTEAEKKKSI